MRVIVDGLNLRDLSGELRIHARITVGGPACGQNQDRGKEKTAPEHPVILLHNIDGHIEVDRLRREARAIRAGLIAELGRDHRGSRPARKREL